MVDPLVTVVLPVHNGEAFVREAVISILDQSFRQLELLVVDDASTDGTAAIVESFADPRLRVLANASNIGLARSLNRGIEASGAPYVARMDADDLALPLRLERQMELLERRPEVGLCCTNVSSVDATGAAVSAAWWPRSVLPLEWELLWANPVAHPSVVLRRDVLEESGLRYRDVPAEDDDLWVRLALRTRFVRLDEVLLHYRVHGSNRTIVDAPEHLGGALGARREYASAVAGRSAPPVHDALTYFGERTGSRSDMAGSGGLAVTWIRELVDAVAERFEWDRATRAAVTLDAQRRALSVVARLPAAEAMRVLPAVLAMSGSVAGAGRFAADACTRLWRRRGRLRSASARGRAG